MVDSYRFKWQSVPSSMEFLSFTPTIRLIVPMFATTVSDKPSPGRPCAIIRSLFFSVVSWGLPLWRPHEGLMDNWSWDKSCNIPMNQAWNLHILPCNCSDVGSKRISIAVFLKLLGQSVQGCKIDRHTVAGDIPRFQCSDRNRCNKSRTKEAHTQISSGAAGRHHSSLCKCWWLTQISRSLEPTQPGSPFSTKGRGWNHHWHIVAFFIGAAVPGMVWSFLPMRPGCARDPSWDEANSVDLSKLNPLPGGTKLHSKDEPCMDVQNVNSGEDDHVKVQKAWLIIVIHHCSTFFAMY